MGNSSSKRTKQRNLSGQTAWRQPQYSAPEPSSYTYPSTSTSSYPTSSYPSSSAVPSSSGPSSAVPPSYNEATSYNAPVDSKEQPVYREVQQPAHSNNLPKDHALQTLAQYDLVFIVDDSGSMTIGSRWKEATNSLAALVDKVAHYDDDGIDVYFLNSPRVGNGLHNGHAVREFFRSVRPDGSTPIGRSLEKIVGGYLKNAESLLRKHPDDLDKYIKPVIYTVITDGVPTDDPETVIKSLAKRLDKYDFPTSQVGIQFVQVGDDASASEYLTSLDDDLPKSGIRDIVDTTPYRGHALDDELLIKIMLGGINKRIDKKKVSGSTHR